ncbi:uncharacterized protein BJX67DRAFT_364423 [Aspergillus lucknowensis]|uniref:Uncharacterized protein n=1 Tax=Aspergillus lucknowensis TaxID=176173 RepID=A0ABR4LIH1_9EURO
MSSKPSSSARTSGNRPFASGISGSTRPHSIRALTRPSRPAQTHRSSGVLNSRSFRLTRFTSTLSIRARTLTTSSWQFRIASKSGVSPSESSVSTSVLSKPARTATTR